MNTKTERFGIHLMIDGYGSPKDVLSDKEALRRMLVEIPQELGMHTISEPLVVEVGPLSKKDPGGLSGFVLIAESHISFHTFPNRGFVTIDVYTCQDALDTESLIQRFKQIFQLKKTESYVQMRGIHYPSENIK